MSRAEETHETQPVAQEAQGVIAANAICSETNQRIQEFADQVRSGPKTPTALSTLLNGYADRYRDEHSELFSLIVPKDQAPQVQVVATLAGDYIKKMREAASTALNGTDAQYSQVARALNASATRLDTAFEELGWSECAKGPALTRRA